MCGWIYILCKEGPILEDDFYPAAGLGNFNPRWDEILGSKLDLSQIYDQPT